MTDTLTLAHLSDVHLGPLPPFGVRHWNVKRVLGFANWQRNRKHVHQRGIVDRLVADLRAQQPDHIAVTGDLINIGLPAEYVEAAAWLAALGPGPAVTVVPGNHDIYVRLPSDPGVLRWRAHMTGTGEASSQSQSAKTEFPFVRRFGRLALIGLNSAVPTRPFQAIGEVGAAQLERLRATLRDLRRDGAKRVVLIHHPPLPGMATRSKALRDAAALERVLAEEGAELVLHGHNHQRMLSYRSSETGGFPIVGVPSASAVRSHKHEPLARYHLFRLAVADGPLTITLIARGLLEPDGAMVEIERTQIAPATSVHA